MTKLCGCRCHLRQYFRCRVATQLGTVTYCVGYESRPVAFPVPAPRWFGLEMPCLDGAGSGVRVGCVVGAEMLNRISGGLRTRLASDKVVSASGPKVVKCSLCAEGGQPSEPGLDP